MTVRHYSISPVWLSALLLGALSFVPVLARASSQPMAWVMTDITAQAHCTVIRSHGTTPVSQPCPAGTIHHVYQMPVAQAEAEHRPYLPTTASPLQELRWEAQGAAQDQARAHVMVTPNYIGCGAMTGADTTLIWTTNYGSNVNTGVTYNVDNSCYFRAQYDHTEYNWGAEAHKFSIVPLDDATTGRTSSDLDYDSPSGCYGLPHKAAFSGYPIYATHTINAHFQIYDHISNGVCIGSHDAAYFSL